MSRRSDARRPLFVPRTAPEVCVVEASAGSGKTHALAMRYLALLLDDHPIDETKLRSILAITFTNKATVEMKRRILEYLKALALGHTTCNGIPLCADLGLAPAIARQRAERALDLLLGRYASFQVQTIDSFVNALLNGSAFLLNLAAHFTVEPRHERYLAYSLDRLVERARREATVRRLFKRFIEQYLLVEQRGGWLPRETIRSEMEKLFEVAARRDGDLAPSGVNLEKVFTLKAALLAELRQLSRMLPVGTDQRFANALIAFLAGSREHFTVDDLSTFFTHDRFPAKKDAAVDAGTARRWRRIRHLIRRVVETEARAWYSCYIRLFAQVYRGAVEQAVADDAVLMALLSRTARRLFDDERTTVPELYLRIAARHRHVLIDEFQDTSDLQWRTLAPLVEEVLASGGTLFYVGDKKQAIYRFRGGDVGLFDEVRERFAGFGVRTERLDTNYRSRWEIVAFNNDVFAPQNLRRFVDDIAAQVDGVDAATVRQRILGVFSDVQQQARSNARGGYVTVQPVDGANADDQERLIRTIVRSLVAELRRRNFRFRDIAVLVRSNDQVERVSEWLLSEPLPGGEVAAVQSEKTLNILQHPIIKEVCALLSFLADPADDVAFVSFISGALYTTAASVDPADLERFLLAHRRRGEGVPLHRCYAETFPEAWTRWIAPLQDTVGRRPLYEFVVWVLSRMEAWRRFPGAAAYLAKLLELLSAHEEEAASPWSFLEWLASAPEEELFVAVAEGDAITVLTIHKAKGLQFPAVICPFVTIDKTLRGGILLEERDGELTLVRSCAAYALYSPAIASLMQGERVARLLDELNTVYVAFTRAADELHLIVPASAGRGHNLARVLLPSCPVHRGTPVHRTLPVSDERSRWIEPIPSDDWLTRVREEHPSVDRVRRWGNARVGDIVHALLAAAGNEGAAAAIRSLRPVFRAEPSFERCAAVVERIFADPACRRFFAVPRGTQVFTEQEITDTHGRTWRVDRMLVHADAVDVVEFKTSAVDDPEQYRQVLRYRELAAVLYPDRPVRAWIVHCPPDGDLRVEPVEGTP